MSIPPVSCSPRRLLADRWLASGTVVASSLSHQCQAVSPTECASSDNCYKRAYILTLFRTTLGSRTIALNQLCFSWHVAWLANSGKGRFVSTRSLQDISTPGLSRDCGH